MQNEIKQTEVNKPKPLIVFSRKIAEEIICTYGLFSKLYKIEKAKCDSEHKQHCYFFYPDEDVKDAFNTLRKEAIEYKAERERIAAEGDIDAAD